MKKIVVLMFIAVFALTGIAAAKGPGHLGREDGLERGVQKGAPGTFWEREKVSEALSLTGEEKAALTELHNDHRSAVQELRNNLKEQHLALREIMESEDFSPSNAREKFKNTEKIRSMIQEERFELRIEQREILGQERFVKMENMEKRAMRKRRGGKRVPSTE